MDDQDLKNQVTRYQPSQKIIETSSRIKLLATVGPSASGKTTLMRALAENSPDFHLVLGETSRALRPNETSGIDMIFRSKTEIAQDLQKGELLQVVVGVNGDLYCTRTRDFPIDGIGLFPLIPLGVKQFRSLPLAFFAAAFIVPTTYELWQGWLADQAKLSGWTDEILRRRLSEAKSSYEFALNDPGVRFVLNDEVHKAAGRLRQVGRGETPDDEAQAKEAAVSNLEKLKEVL